MYVKVKEGMSIAQLRFFFGKIEDSVIKDEDFIRAILNLRDNETNHGTLSVDISNTYIDEEENELAAAYETKDKSQINNFIDLEKKDEEADKYEQNKFWNKKRSIERYIINVINNCGYNYIFV
jgi:hypothetical protein